MHIARDNMTETAEKTALLQFPNDQFYNAVSFMHYQSRQQCAVTSAFAVYYHSCILKRHPPRAKTLDTGYQRRNRACSHAT